MVRERLDAGNCTPKAEQWQAGRLKSNTKGPAKLRCWPFDFAQDRLRISPSYYFRFERVAVNVSGVAEVTEGDLTEA